MFNYPQKNGVTHKYNTEKKNCRRRFRQEIHERMRADYKKPLSISIARLMAFNRVNIGKFFNLLKEIRLNYLFTAAPIDNGDETGFSGQKLLNFARIIE